MNDALEPKLDLEGLVAEAHKNTCEDRATMKEIVKEMKEALLENPSNVDLAQALARMCESLSRANAQVIFLAQIRLKGRPKDDGGLSESDAAEAYDAIGNGH